MFSEDCSWSWIEEATAGYAAGQRGQRFEDEVARAQQITGRESKMSPVKYAETGHSELHESGFYLS